MRLTRAAGIAVAATAFIWAAATVATYAAVIRWAATIDDNTLATIHPINDGRDIR